MMNDGLLDSFRVEIKPSVKGIISFGIAFQGIVITILSFGMIFLGFWIFNEIPILSLVIFVIFIFFLLVGKKYLDNVFYEEYIVVTKTQMTLVHKTWWTQEDHKFEIKDIEYLGFVGGYEFTRHPMENDVVDFTGLGTAERELQFLIDDGTMEIITINTHFKFGKNVPSWDAEEIVTKIENYLGIKFNQKVEQNNTLLAQ